MESLLEVASRDPRVMLVVGDLGFGVVDKFAAALPQQFVNAGVAEQNMTGLAAGLALSGRIVFTYSIANFPLLRCFEQIRNDICYHRANVKIVAVGGGLSYGALGMSHHASEDLAIARALPNLMVVAPNDPGEAEEAARAIAAADGPCYLRLGRAGEPRLSIPGRFELGRGVPVREGSDLAIIAGAGMLGVAIDVASELASGGLEARVLGVHTIKPLDEGAILAAASGMRAVFTLEEHSRIGGLGSAVAEVLADQGLCPPVFVRFGLQDQFVSIGGSHAYLRARCGLDSGAILLKIRETMEPSALARSR